MRCVSGYFVSELRFDFEVIEHVFNAHDGSTSIDLTFIGAPSVLA